MKKTIIVIITVFISLSQAFAYEKLDTDYLSIKRNSPLFRVGITGGDALLNLGDEDTNKIYGGVYGIFLDWNMLNRKGQRAHSFDIFTRLNYRNFHADTDISAGIIYEGDIDILAGGAGIRYGYSINLISRLFQFYGSLHGEILYAKEESDIGEENDYMTPGIVAGLGIELAPSRYYSIFVEYNYGYAPVGKEDSNLEGQQIWFGGSYRTR